MSLRKKIATSAVALLVATGALELYSPQLQQFLGRWEGEGQNQVYADRLAGGLPTVCKGITRHTSPIPVVVGEYWSAERCAEVERLVVEHGQLSLANCLTNPAISQNTFDALSSHAHNFGVPSTCASRAVVLINAGDILGGCKALAWGPTGKPVWAYVKDTQGKPVLVRGLHLRRLDEMRLCST
jgi:GH24 family phage-related lysozyme (muramidase)